MESSHGFKTFSLFKLYINYTAVCLLFLLSTTAHANLTCSSLFETKNESEVTQKPKEDTLKPAALFLQQVNPNLHTSKPVERASKVLKAQQNINLSKPADKISQWITRLDQQYKKIIEGKTTSKHFKEFFYSQFLIKRTEVPESYFEQQVRIARERGHGNITLSPEQRNQLIDTLILDQKKSLEPWLDYFTSKDSEQYPMWTKYWALMGLAKLSKYNPETYSFGNRTKDTVAPFPELNREALALVVDVIQKKVLQSDSDITTVDYFIKERQGSSFGKYYAKAIRYVSLGKVDLSTTDGIWVKYDQGTNHMPLVKSLEGKNTGWCTAAEGTAETQLSNGDFYVYYTKKNGLNTEPRVAIRMENDQIAEVRGIGKDQNLDSKIANTDIIDKKLTEFGEDKAQSYKTKSRHMSLLTEIDNKHRKNIELTSSELKFIYEIDELVQGFGYSKDPRLTEILSTRNFKKDLSIAFEGKYKENEISFTTEEALSGNSKYHYGDIKISNVKQLENINLPVTVDGNIYINDAVILKNIKFPTRVKGSVSLERLTSAENMHLPKKVDGELVIPRLTSAENVVFPEYLEKTLNLNLTSAKKVVFPREINGNLFLNQLTTASDVKFPNTINGTLSLENLTSAKNVKLPSYVKTNIFLRNLKSAEGLIFPKKLTGTIYLLAINTAKGLKLPEIIDGTLDLESLTSANGLILPKSVSRLSLEKITSLQGLILPEKMPDYLVLSSLTSAKGLKLPKKLKENLNINPDLIQQIEWY